MPASSAARVLVAIVASSGGVEATTALLGQLAPHLAAAIAIIQHRTAAVPNVLVQTLQRATSLQVVAAVEGMVLEAGTVHVSPPDRHLTVTADRRVHLVDGPRRNYLRSSADVLFETASRVYGADLLAVVLTGYGSDGRDGAEVVAAAGGLVIAQDPSTAQAPPMPTAAIATGAVREVLSIPAIAAAIMRFAAAREAAGDTAPTAPRAGAC